jgi:hypothetical protein
MVYACHAARLFDCHLGTACAQLSTATILVTNIRGLSLCYMQLVLRARPRWSNNPRPQQQGRSMALKAITFWHLKNSSHPARQTLRYASEYILGTAPLRPPSPAPERASQLTNELRQCLRMRMSAPHGSTSCWRKVCQLDCCWWRRTSLRMASIQTLKDNDPA